MLRGIYTSATGMVAEMDRQNIIANNLANINTTGFKKDNVISVPFSELLINAYDKNGHNSIGKLGLGVQAVTPYADFSSGSLLQTDNMSDLAMVGTGLFAVQTPNGTRYTRAGNFVVNSNNTLVTQEGYPVLGQNGPIQVAPIREEGRFDVTEDGDVVQGGTVINRLQVFDMQNMVKQGEYLYTNAGTPTPATNYRILQGTLEQSNVNPVSEMLQMINAQRAYDTNSKAITAHDETLDKLVNDLGRTS